MPVLLCAGKGTKGGCWEAAPAQGAHAEAGDGGVEAAGQGPASNKGFTGAICPVTITANEVSVGAWGPVRTINCKDYSTSW